MGTAYGISNVAGWYRADRGVNNSSGSACADGQGVATWIDQSGSGNHLLQATTANQPIFGYHGDGLNQNGWGAGKPTVNLYDGLVYGDSRSPQSFAASGLSVNAASGFGCLYTYRKFRNVNTNGGFQPREPTPITSAFGSNGGFGNMFYQGDAGCVLGYFNGSGVTDIIGATAGDDLYETETLGVMGYFVNGSNGALSAYYNNLVFNASTGSGASGTLTGFTFGLPANGNTGFVGGGTLDELIVFSALPSQTTVQSLISQMLARLGKPNPSTYGKRTLLTVGDSITYGYTSNFGLQQTPFGGSFPNRIATERPDLQVINLGWNSETAAGWISNIALLQRFASTNNSKTKIATLMLGTNDINATPGTAGIETGIYSNLTSIVSALHTLNVKVAIGTVLSRQWSSNQSQGEITRGNLNTLIKANTAGADLVVDAAADSRLSNSTNTQYFDDGTHPTIQDGYPVLASLFLPAVNAMAPQTFATAYAITGPSTIPAGGSGTYTVSPLGGPPATADTLTATATWTSNVTATNQVVTLPTSGTPATFSISVAAGATVGATFVINGPGISANMLPVTGPTITVAAPSGSGGGTTSATDVAGDRPASPFVTLSDSAGYRTNDFSF